MRLVSLVAICLFVTAASVQGRSIKSNPSWMLFPDDEGKLHLAILSGPEPLTKINEVEDITFHLYTKSNPDTPVQVFVGDMSGSAFDASKPTKFFIHGFSSNAFGSWGTLIKDAYLRSEDCNVIGVDWSGLAAPPLYNVAKANTKPVGQYVGKMVDYLVSQGSQLRTTHLVGHSLGSHVSGFAGKSLTTGMLGRITGLDPALPLFSFDDISGRLHDSDASFVDIIHTCRGWLGFDAAIGHADFYPNGGKDQPGCGVDLTGACSHGRSHDFYAESVESSNFRAIPCDSWENFQNNQCSGSAVSMGARLDTGTRGTYYLATGSNSPFALG